MMPKAAPRTDDGSLGLLGIYREAECFDYMNHRFVSILYIYTYADICISYIYIYIYMQFCVHSYTHIRSGDKCHILLINVFLTIKVYGPESLIWVFFPSGCRT